MNALAIKDVEFNGTQLKAVQNELGKIFVGISWICNGIGFSKGQKDRQVLNIQQDEVLRNGCFKFEAGVFDQNNETLALNVDYLPLWLAKISITPTMKKDSPDLVEKLIEYQLKAKDVLALAFIKKEVINQQPLQTTVQVVMPDVDSYFKGINSKIDRLYSDMRKFVNVMMDWKEQSSQPIPMADKAIETYSEIMDNISTIAIPFDSCSEWKTNSYSLMDNLINIDKRFSSRGNVMNYIYKYMNKNYGIVWQQEIKDYAEVNGSDIKPSTIDIVYNNETYRSIFDSILVDLIGDTDVVKVTSTDLTLDEIINPLAMINNDKSPNYAVSYRKVYKAMEEKYGISWKNHITRCLRSGMIKPTKKRVVEEKPKLRKQFELTVKSLMC